MTYIGHQDMLDFRIEVTESCFRKCHVPQIMLDPLTRRRPSSISQLPGKDFVAGGPMTPGSRHLFLDRNPKLQPEAIGAFFRNTGSCPKP